MSEAGDRSKRLFEADAFSALLGIQLIDAGDDRARLSLVLSERHLNFLGGGHGGVIFALADMAFGLASNSRGVMSIGIDAHISYIAGARTGDRLEAVAALVSRNRRTAVYRVDVRRGDDTLAAFTGTVYVTGKPIPAQAP